MKKRKRSPVGDWLTGKSVETSRNGYGDGKRDKRERRRGGERR